MITRYRIFEAWGNLDKAPEVAKGKIIATNFSYWSWEDDADYVDAFLYLVENEKLYLILVKEHIKYGLGRGEQTATLYSDYVGNVYNANTNQIASILKQYGHTKSRASSGFKKDWQDVASSGTGATEKRPLKDIIFDYTDQGIKNKAAKRFDL